MVVDARGWRTEVCSEKTDGLEEVSQEINAVINTLPTTSKFIDLAIFSIGGPSSSIGINCMCLCG